MQLDDVITQVPGIGNKYAQTLAKLEIKQVQDLLWHVPSRYEDFSYVCKINELAWDVPATVIAKVAKINNVYTRNGKKFTKAIVEDKTGKLDIIWFNQHYITTSVEVGNTIALSGKLDPKSRRPQFISPVWEVIHENKPIHTAGIIPVYPATEGVSPKWIRSKIAAVLDNIVIEEMLPADILDANNLEDLDTAIRHVHFPKTLEDAAAARKRLAFDEVLFVHLHGLQIRSNWDSKLNSHIIKQDKDAHKDFLSQLPYKLTHAQLRVIEEILEDMQKPAPMNRLVQGDVGSGKTVVAAMAILQAAQSGFNSIYMAPTQILAEQHYATLTKMLAQFNISISVITGNKKNSQIPATDSKKPQLIIATHAILYNLDKISTVGLIIIDEQHKFGVSQRTELINHYTNKLAPNLLTMTATPIPRSLALTFYGDLDLSVIDEMPEGRQIVDTLVISEKKRQASYNWMSQQIKSTGTQVFWVCPFIEESESETLSNVKAATAEFSKLQTYFSEFKLDLLHGRLKPEEKANIIENFARKKFDILVSTPVIEVGIDIPGANLIVIETPERFGLASLHQLRGRVGRGGSKAYCILIASENAPDSLHRLKHMEKVHQGNKLAEIDLKLRGPGDIYGTSQHGYAQFKVADITDIDLIKRTKDIAANIYINVADYPIIAKRLDNLMNIGEN